MKKNMKFLVNVSCVILLAIFVFPHFSLGITLQDLQTGSQSDASKGNVRVERIVVKEIANSSITSSDGTIIRFDNSTKVFKNVNQGSKMRTAELHYVDGRLVAIYIM